jgi:hypothetical protein
MLMPETAPPPGSTPSEEPTGGGLAASWRRTPAPRRALAIMMPLAIVVLLARGRLAGSGLFSTSAVAAMAHPAATTPPTLPPSQPPAVASAAPPGSSSAAPTSNAKRASSPSPSGGDANRAPDGKTFERQAADFVASGDYPSAIQIYEQLASSHPDRPAFRDASRILREKMTGAP